MRSTSEVYMHIAIANFYLLGITGPKMPADIKEDTEKTVTAKADVITWLKRSLDAVKEAHLAAKPKDLERKVQWPIVRRRLMACIFASSSTPMSTWDN